MKVFYPAIFKKAEEGGYVVTFPDFNEAVTEGDTLEEAEFNAAEVLTLTLEVRMERGPAIPAPKTKTKKGQRLIAPAARVQLALLLKWNKGDRTTAQLARSLNTSWGAAQKLEDPRNTPTLKQAERAASALGKRLFLELK